VSLVAPPFSPPTVPQDPNFGGLRFTLRVEQAHHRRVRLCVGSHFHSCCCCCCCCCCCHKWLQPGHQKFATLAPEPSHCAAACMQEGVR
jgi:hypothetical protein